MERISDKRKCMASLAVFRQLYNSKKDIYNVISEFAKQVILDKDLYSFNLEEMKSYMNEIYGFELPSAVIRSALRLIDFIQKQNKNTYIVTRQEQKSQSETFKRLYQEATKKNLDIINSLVSYIETKKGTKFLETDKDELAKAFCSYVIDDVTATKYSELISGFILTNSGDRDFILQLNHIKQGVIIYVGLAYNVNNENVDAIDRPLNIYLETEILFSLAGYNGSLHKTLFDEFYSLVEQINKQNKKPVISLLYFEETAKEIESYFVIAEKIVRGEITLDPSKQAMIAIVNGCHEPYEIAIKKNEFYTLLKERHISLDTQRNYYDKNNRPFNIEHTKFLGSEKESYSENEIIKELTLLNYINIKRGNNDRSIFRNIGHILLSASKLTFDIAFDNDVRKDKEVPLATSLEFLTNRFWFSLNKGLNSDMNLLSFNIISRAQIALSAQVSAKIGELFNEYEEEDKAGKFDNNQRKKILASLHKKAARPEDITKDNEDTYLNIITIQDIDQIRAEQSADKESRRKEKEELEHKIDNLNKTVASQQIQLKESAETICDERNLKYIYEYEEARNTYKKALTNWVRSRYIKKLSIVASQVSLYVILVILLCVFLNWKIIKNRLVVAILGFLALLIPHIRPLFNLKIIQGNFNLLLSKKQKHHLKRNLIKSYLKENEPPLRRICTIEDVFKEFKSKTNSSI